MFTICLITGMFQSSSEVCKDWASETHHIISRGNQITKFIIILVSENNTSQTPLLGMYVFALDYLFVSIFTAIWVKSFMV
jgi:hypothetical protein